MDPIVYALAAPIIGALLYPALHDHPKLTRIFDRFMYVAVPLLVLSQVLGHQIEYDGWQVRGIAILMGIMTAGILLPIAIEHLFQNIASKTEALSLIAGFLGLSLHALLEGASLNTEAPIVTIPLTAHRLGVGLMIWWILFPRYGSLISLLGIGGLLVATLAGFMLGDVLPHEFTGSDYFQAFVAGTLIHVIIHERHHGSPHAHEL